MITNGRIALLAHDVAASAWFLAELWALPQAVVADAGGESLRRAIGDPGDDATAENTSRQFGEKSS